MLDSIYHMTLKILKNCIFGVKTSRFSLILCNVIMDVITLRPENLLTTSGLSILLHDVISLPDVTSCNEESYRTYALHVVSCYFTIMSCS